jgi:hypothetical protein
MRCTGRLLRSAAALAGAGLIAATASAAGGEGAGEVVALRGVVMAQSPGDSPRRLLCGDTISAGDRIRTTENARVGVMSGGFYTQLGAESAAELENTPAGTPSVALARGHLRVLDTDAGGAGAARIATPGLLAARAGTDTEAFALGEKAGVLSMVCTHDGPVEVTRAGESAPALGPGAGQCAVSKPREPVYMADASHERLPILDDDACRVGPLGGLAASRFGPPTDVALAATGPAPLPNLDPIPMAFRQPCDSPGSGCLGAASLSGGGAPPAGATQFPFIPPVPPAP